MSLLLPIYFREIFTSEIFQKIVLTQFIYFRYNLDEPQRAYIFITNEPSGWVHSVMVYHGVGQGITVYHDGRKIATDTSKKFLGSKPKGNGQVLIGKREAGDYTNVNVDELKFYNRQLSQKEIGNMYRRL